jgi:hypothetical protein
VLGFSKLAESDAIKIIILDVEILCNGYFGHPMDNFIRGELSQVGAGVKNRCEFYTEQAIKLIVYNWSIFVGSNQKVM